MTTYDQTSAFDKITDGIAEMPEQWTSPAQAGEACCVYLLDPVLNEGDNFVGDGNALVSQIEEWMTRRLEQND